MDRAGERALPLNQAEKVVIFNAVVRGDGLPDALRQLTNRDRTTVSRAVRIASEFAQRRLTALEANVAKEIVEKAGYSATVSSVEDLFRAWMAWHQFPSLVVVFEPDRPEDLGIKDVGDQQWQVACPRTKNEGLAPARNVTAMVTLESGRTMVGSRGPFVLNPVDKPIRHLRDTAPPVVIRPAGHRSWDLVFAPVSEQFQDRMVSSGRIERIQFGSFGPQQPSRVPSDPQWEQGGACIGIPIAMALGGVPQARLLPGDYQALFEVVDEAGNLAAARFWIVAPPPGGKLEVTCFRGPG